MATINGKYLWVEKESVSYPVEITKQPIEKGVDVTDHVQRQARVMSVNGGLSGDGAANMLQFLKNAQDKGVIVKYVGRNAFVGLISGLTSDHDKENADGFWCSFNIEEVRISESSYVDKLPSPIKAQKIKIVNSGVKQKESKKKSTTTKTATESKSTTKKKKKKEKEQVQKVKFKDGSKWN